MALLDKMLRKSLQRISDASTQYLCQTGATLDAQVESAVCEVLEANQDLQLRLAIAGEKTGCTMKLVLSPIFDKDLGFKGWILATKANNAKVAEYSSYAELQAAVVAAAIGLASPEFLLAVKAACAKVA